MTGRRVRRALFAAVVALIVGHSLWPFLWQAITSLKAPAEIFAIPPTLLPTQPSLEGYTKVFTLRPFVRYVLNSLLVAVGTTILTLGLGAPAAYAVARLRARGGELLLRAGLVGALLPPIVFVLPLYEGIRALGLLNHPLALIVPYTALNLPLTLWMLTSFFRQLPSELEEAARIDGFSRVGVLRHIILPLAAPALATAAILVAIFSWNEFLLALTFMTADQWRTVPVGMAMLSGVTEFEVPWDQISAAVVVTTLPVVLLVLGLQRRIIAGLTAGGIKG
ncbi:MAG: carbohydrate ABC transporter permease [Deltaproteobacteria bacterium]|nr:carbohydrate ABC transporter permease [Deltaproteobacteria bacterium]